MTGDVEEVEETDEPVVAEPTPEEPTTTVTVRCTGHVRREVGTADLEYTFPGSTLRDLLEQFFADHDVADLLIAETEGEATAHGWAPSRASRQAPGGRTRWANRRGRTPGS